MSRDEEIISKRARKNYPGEVSFGALSKEENEHSVAQVSRCTDTRNCTWTEDGTKPQLLGGLGEDIGGGSSLQQMVEKSLANFLFCWASHKYSTAVIMCVCCVCVFFPSILDIKFVGRTSRGHTGGRSHRIFDPPSFCGACLDFCREKDSAIPFPRQP